MKTGKGFADRNITESSQNMSMFPIMWEFPRKYKIILRKLKPIKPHP